MKKFNNYDLTLDEGEKEINSDNENQEKEIVKLQKKT